MSLNRVVEFPNTLIEILEAYRVRWSVSPIYLGGSQGSSGGTGTPPGGFIGQLIQSRVTYDTTELASSATSGSPSLVDNLNHIRARLADLESGATGGGAAGHLHGLTRWIADGVALVYDLPDFAEYVDRVSDDGLEVDPATVGLSVDRDKIEFDAAPGAGSILTAQYVVAQI